MTERKKEEGNLAQGRGERGEKDGRMMNENRGIDVHSRVADAHALLCYTIDLITILVHIVKKHYNIYIL